MDKKKYTLKELSSRITDDMIQDARDCNELSIELRKLIRNNNLNQKQFAELMNKSESEISKWLSGNHNMSFLTIKRIERALNDRLMLWNSEGEVTIHMAKPEGIQAEEMTLTLGIKHDSEEHYLDVKNNQAYCVKFSVEVNATTNAFNVAPSVQ